MKIRLLLTMLLMLSALPALAAGVGGMFSEGRSLFSLVAGNAYAFEKRYFVVGGSLSYYVVDGLGVGLSLEKWSGSDPGITKVAPFVQYVFLPGYRVRPYVGALYRHTVISGLPSINSVGARGGVMIASGSNAFLSAGFAHESYLNCQVSVYRVCSETYPDIGLTFAF